MSSREQATQLSFVRSLLAGRVELGSLDPFPSLSHGRASQIEELLALIRRDTGQQIGIPRLREWDFLEKAVEWPAPLLVRVIRQVGATDVSAALSAIAHLSLGVRLLRTFGSESQSREVETSPSPLLAFALTEASPGSDVSRIQTYAEPQGDGYLLNGTKHWVTNAMFATHFIVLARTTEARAADKPKLTAFLIKKCPGIRITPVSSDVLPGSGVGEVTFQDVRVESSAIVGNLGKGFRVVMSGLSEARLLVSAAVLGASVRAYNDTLARVSERRAFGRSVGKFPSVQYRVADMLADLLAMESLVHAAAGREETRGTVDPVERAIVRLAISRGSARVLDRARELHGAAAFAGNVSASRHWADTRALTLLDGSDLALESYIVLEGTREIRQRYVRMSEASDVLTRLDAASSMFVDKAKARLKKVSSREILGISFEELQARTIELGSSVDQAVRRYGTELVEHQHLHSRLASIAAELATWTALAARVHTEIDQRGGVGAHRMTEVAEIWVSRAQSRIGGLFHRLTDNDDASRDQVAALAYSDLTYPFDIFAAPGRH